jgi:NAD(P)-dependent dehydrogenase (short-subunit alcohol dehydrogenase family)
MGQYIGKAVAITGGGSGLGLAIARRFANEGARIALFDIDAKRAEAAVEELRTEGADVFGMRVDIADKTSIELAAREFATRFGACDILCANVGVQQFGAIDALTDQDWEWVISVNLYGTVHTVNAFLPLLRAGEGRRHILITCSSSFYQIGIRMATYVSSKYAVAGYGEVLRRELAPENINVALLFPGGMATRHLESSIAARPSALGVSRFEMSDVKAMMDDAGIDSLGDLITPDHAVRNLISELDSGFSYLFTHGAYRTQIEAQQTEVLAAYDRMAANP